MKNADLFAELSAMRELGVHVSDATLQHAQNDDLTQYAAISVSDLASLFCELYNT
jgi:hypothetical protein